MNYKPSDKANTLANIITLRTSKIDTKNDTRRRTMPPQ